MPQFQSIKSSIDFSELCKICRSTDFEAFKSCNVRSGTDGFINRAHEGYDERKKHFLSIYGADVIFTK